MAKADKKRAKRRDTEKLLRDYEALKTLLAESGETLEDEKKNRKTSKPRRHEHDADDDTPVSLSDGIADGIADGDEAGGRRRRSGCLFPLAGAGLALGIIAGGLEFDRSIERVDAALAAAPAAAAIRLEAASLRLTTASVTPPGGLLETLRSMGYEARRPLAPGRFLARADGWLEIVPFRPELGPQVGPSFASGGETKGSFVIRIVGRRVVSLRDAADHPLEVAVIPSGEFARIQGPSSRSEGRFIPYDELPISLIDAVVAAEDQRFFEHMGLDPMGILRALWRNVSRGHIAEGGSTITQQLAKNLFLGRERTLHRKLEEAFLALAMERRLSKEEILERYINTVYLGRRGSSSIVGFPDAAYAYFSRGLDELNLSEIATLVGMIPAPNRYAPDRHPKPAKRRRDQVLALMRASEVLTEEAYREAAGSQVTLRPAPFEGRTAPFFVEHADHELATILGEDVDAQGGYDVETSVDLRIQSISEKALAEGLRKLEAETKVPLEGSVVVLSAETGAILALVGGRSFGASQFNRAVSARRPIGSLVKPLIVLAAVEEKGEAITPRLELLDEPLVVKTSQGSYRPKNIDGKFRGKVTLRTAIEHSLNIPFVRLTQSVGVDVVRRYLGFLGLHAPRDIGLSIALGAIDASPLEVASAFSVLASYGVLRAPYSIARVSDPDGTTVFAHEPKARRLASPQAAYLVADLMRGVVEHGTGRRVRALGYDGEVAGKTGTSNETKDAWFVGFDRELVVVVWVGADQPQSIGRTGSRAALPIFARVMEEIRGQDAPPQNFIPAGLATVTICSASGLLPTEGCPETAKELFWSDDVPSEPCTMHGPAGWIDALFEMTRDLQAP
ncbi:MAG: PBP1A family penicillin-binding protein [Deltaproteobacteria bacterium]|nr:PBP1A family penicillin-binding protein [Deltaproteobacteria bacterium]